MNALRFAMWWLLLTAVHLLGVLTGAALLWLAMWGTQSDWPVLGIALVAMLPVAVVSRPRFGGAK